MVMKFLFCFPRRRRRAAYSISSTYVYYRNSPSSSPVVTFGSRLSSTDNPEISDESLYESIKLSSPDGNGIISQTSIEFQENGGYAIITSRLTPRKSIPMDETGLYAVIDRSRQVKNRIQTQTNSAISTYASTMCRAVPPLPPLSTLPPQIHARTTRNTITSVCCDLPSPQVLRPRTLFDQTKRKITICSDLYAEIANGSASGTISPSLPCSPSAQSFNESGTYVNLSEFDATPSETDNTDDESHIGCPIKYKGKYERF